MGNSALKLAAAGLLLTLIAAQVRSASAVPQGAVTQDQASDSNVVPNHITGYTAWDDAFFYVAVRVTKPALTGENKAPFSNPLEDDAVVISFQTDNDHKSTIRTAHTITVCVSEAGGTQLYSGEKSTPLFSSLDDLQARLADIDKNEKDPNAQQARRLALLGSIPKIQVTQSGAPRLGAGNYPGYTVEIAIPWSDLGGQPETGAKFGFNIAAISKSIGSPKILSLDSSVHGISDTDNPSVWGEITLAGEAKAGTRVELTSPRVIANKPTIDGVFAENEWNHLSEFEFGELTTGRAPRNSLAATVAARTRPDFTPAAPRPVVAVARPSASEVKPHAPFKVEHLVFAQYEYAYQGDTRKDAPAQMVTNPDHSTALAHHPLDGAGPWFSYDRADWHRAQLTEMRKEGVDVVLPVYRGDPAHRRAYADKGLLVLASALGYLRKAGLDYPQVGLYLDTQSLVEIVGDRVDLHDATAQSALYGIIRDFYLRIPPAFRCCVQLDPSEGARTAYPVFLSVDKAFKAWDSAFVAFARHRFKLDFGGADLVFVGPAGLGANAGLDSYVAAGDAGAGRIKTVGIRAGFDLDVARNFTADASALPARKEGAAYRAAWVSAVEKHPDWILLQDWNDFTLGGEIAPSMEAGYSTADLTRAYTHMFNGSDRRLHSKVLWNDAPAQAVSGSRFTVQVRVQNAGLETWGPAKDQAPIELEYRWRKAGEVISGKPAGTSVGTVFSGGEVNVPLHIEASARGAALAPGDYTLELAIVSPKERSGEAGASVVQVPVHIGAAADSGAVTVVDSDVLIMMEAGGVYPVTAKLRNDSGAPWTRARGYRVTARLYKMIEGPAGLAEAPVSAADASAVLQKDVAPGEECDVQLLLPITDPEGKPLPVWTPDAGFNYAVRWEVAPDGGGPAAASFNGGAPVTGFVSAPTLVGISEFDFGVRFMQDATLPTLPGEHRLPIILGVKNIGPQTWKRDSVRVGYHWYYQDGTEFLWEDETTALPHDLPPGEGVNNLLTYVTAPPCDGNYFLVWDVKFGDTWGSTSAVTRVFDEQVHPVQVTGGRLVFADLAKSFNIDGVTDLNDLRVGDFDGKGGSFPAALIPPFTDDGVVAAGLWQPYEKTGPESPRHISFRWGSKEARSHNFVECRGQRLDLGKYAGKCRIVHIVAASINKNITTNIKLVFQEPTGESEDLYALSVSRWDQPPIFGEDPVFTCTRHHTAAGSQDGTVSLYHYKFIIRDPRRIAALKLPNEPNIRIAAVTLEQ